MCTQNPRQSCIHMSVERNSGLYCAIFRIYSVNELEKLLNYAVPENLKVVLMYEITCILSNHLKVILYIILIMIVLEIFITDIFSN